MLETKTLLSSFSPFIKFLNIFGASKVRLEYDSRLDKLQRFYTFIIIVSYLFLLFSNLLNNFPGSNHVALYASSIDRSTLVLIIVGIFCDVTFRARNTAKIFKSFDEIDIFLAQNFKLSVDYRKIYILNIIIFVFLNASCCVLFIRQFLHFYLGVYQGIVLVLYILGMFVAYTLKGFYLAIIVQFYLRFKSIHELLAIKPEKFVLEHKLVFEELFMKVFELQQSFNDNFGFIILLLIGESNKI